MRMTTSSSVGAGLVVLVATVCLLLPAATRAQLQVGFYNTSCPNAEALVRQAVAAAFANNSGIAAGLIRLHFHDCFVRGCDASVLLSVNPGGGKTEREAPPNNPSLRGFEVPAGRRDGNVSKEGDALKNLPGPNNTATGLIDGFAAKNLTAEEMVVLSGSHTIGRSHCDSFLFKNRERLANGTISPAYQALLEALCPPTTNQFTPNTTEIDLSTPTVLDNNYYKLLPLNLGLHFSDDQLIRNATTAPNVAAFAANETLWKEKFISAMIKMGRIEVNTGAQGEVRLNCSIVNAPSSSTGIEMLLPGTSDDRADEVATS
ncbi:peroxidase 1-like isoform X2 [Phragmites australis]|uniref:peroxidase 1-like isoform X2 n=1 Tax=Phragmites australis TaxID=29695 RepID=UPI002D76554D|nr:peroxidase 1-like isoform X2 [Phragmites australis]